MPTTWANTDSLISKSSKIVNVFLIVLLIILLLGSGFFLYRSWKNRKEKDEIEEKNDKILENV